MLVPIVFVLALLLTLTTALLEQSLAATKIAIRTSTARYSDLAVGDGVTDFTAALATYVAAHGSSGPWPSAPIVSFPRPLCGSAAVGTPACPLSATIAGRITDSATQTTASIPVDARNAQTAVIAENRISAVVSATIATSNGTLLGVRTRQLTYRVFEAPPYAIVAGARDSATDGIARAAGAGDSGGAAAERTQPGDEPGEAHDTRIHVVLACSTVTPNVIPFQNDQAPAGNDGLPWGNAAAAAYEAPCRQPASPADAFADRTWVNGNASESSWTP